MELTAEQTLKYVSDEIVGIINLHNGYRGLIKELAEANMIPNLSKFIPHKFFVLDRARVSSIYCKFGYFYGEGNLKEDALVLPFARILFCSANPIGDGLNPIYKLFRDFSDSKGYKFKHSEDLSNPFSVA